MKIAATIARYLMALIFLVFGANKFFNFIPAPPTTGVIAQFSEVMISTKYMWLVGLFEVGGGVLLLANRFVPLALALLAPVIVNILFVNVAMAPQGLPSGIAVTVFWILVFLRVRSSFDGIFAQRKQE